MRRPRLPSLTLRRLPWRSLVLGVGVGLWLTLAAARGGYWERGAPAARLRVVAVVDPSSVQVLDGDTYRVAGRVVRLLGADTPEKSAPWFDGDQEPWASRAAAFVRRTLAGARRVTLLSPGERDVYRRSLMHVFVDGRPLALLLVERGLAYPDVERFGDGGLPDLARQLEVRARRPAFEAPWRWRREHHRRR